MPLRGTPRRRAARAPLAPAVLLAAATLVAAPSGTAQAPRDWRPCGTTAASCEPTPVRAEFRGVWVASVANIDWPSRPGLPTDSAQAELVALLDDAARNRMNAIILQVRPAADALYPSKYEPWSEYLTGRQGTAPAPRWDPLAFAVEAAHARGLELHAWFNPYRARHNSAKGPEARSHIARREPALVRRYGEFLWMDPGSPTVQRRTLDVVTDIVRRYDVDGVHLDDYFYPYPVQRNGRDVPFPDDRSYATYVKKARRAGRTPLARDDWRRANVDSLMTRLDRAVHEVKPWVRFGISPFGIWRPGHPAEVTGFDAYAKLYADSRLWLERGWADYFAPQLYWPIPKTGQPYAALLRWWQSQNPLGRHLWVGNAAYRVTGRDAWGSAEYLAQVDSTRAAGVGGNIHFNARVLQRDASGVATALRTGPYAEPAVVPATPWRGGRTPCAPLVTGAGESVTIVADRACRVATGPAAEAAVARWYEVRRLVRGVWEHERVPAAAQVTVPAGDAAVVAVRTVSRTGVGSGYRSLERLGQTTR